MIVETVDEDEFGYRCSIGLRRSIIDCSVSFCRFTFHVLVYRETSPIWWVPSTAEGILTLVCVVDAEVNFVVLKQRQSEPRLSGVMSVTRRTA